MWTVYMLRCRDGSLYTGVTNNLLLRLRRPIELAVSVANEEKLSVFVAT